jgi:large subunit ribosomal protein L18
MNRKRITAVRHERIRKKVSGTAQRPRLAVHFSGRHIYAQVINDETGATLASVNTTEAAFRESAKANADTATRVGTAIAQRAKEKSIGSVVFDRGGFQFHGKVKALADAARAEGLNF